MFIAHQKRKSNIAEYVIYMFQVEDLIRSCNFDISRIDAQIIGKYDLPYNDRRDMREWYLSIARFLNEGGLRERGHIPLLNSIMNDLNSLHLKMLATPEESRYIALYENARDAINELRIKSASPRKNDIEVCLEGLYGLLLLKLRRKRITEATESAFGLISEMLSCLSARFKEEDEDVH